MYGKPERGECKFHGEHIDEESRASSIDVSVEVEGDVEYDMQQNEGDSDACASKEEASACGKNEENHRENFAVAEIACVRCDATAGGGECLDDSERAVREITREKVSVFADASNVPEAKPETIERAIRYRVVSALS